jgi:Sec-independent protein secretion pathway component TatC
MTILAIPLYLLFELGMFLLRFLPPGNVARGIRLRDAWAKARSRG